MSRSALVTGASRGIGKAIALQLAKDGYNVAITDLAIQRDLAQETVAEISKFGVKSLFVEADSSKRDQVFKAVDLTYKEFGSFNTIVNNAGIAQVAAITDITEDELRKVTDINVGGVLWGIQAAAKKFNELGTGGKIINGCSIVSHTAFPLLGAYSASKFAVKGLTQAAAKELARKKITVNGYCPGIVLTPMWDLIDSKMAEATGVEPGVTLQSYIDGIALGRGSEPQDIANLISFLASEKADYITGQSLVVDGGIVFP
jgi:meso-butanediol dehydrogenase/(S,S)-butanediol dehydrogenase/diacetyl reductase